MAARRFAVAALGGVPELADRVALLVSELATNAIRHAASGFELAVWMDGKRVRVEVRDAGRSLPELRHGGPDEPGGRGLVIVDALADAWGVERRPQGKTVWFELLVPPAGRRQRRSRISPAG